jgi:hypothetical protein
LIEPGEIRLNVAMVPRHRQIAGKQDQVAWADTRAPVFLDSRGMVAPAGRISLAPYGPREGQMKVRDRPNVH